METAKVRKAVGDALLKYNTLCTRVQLDDCEISHLEGASARFETEILPRIRRERKAVKDQELEVYNALLQGTRDEEKVSEIRERWSLDFSHPRIYLSVGYPRGNVCFE